MSDGAVGSLSQSVMIVQSNALANAITINNAGSTAGSVDGLFAEISNEYVATYNAAAFGNTGGDISVETVSRTAQAYQSNAIANSIALSNSAAIGGGPEAGVRAEIVNYDVTLRSSAFPELS